MHCNQNHYTPLFLFVEIDDAGKWTQAGGSRELVDIFVVPRPPMQACENSRSMLDGAQTEEQHDHQDD
jgi:hypothetical protein